MEKLENVQQFGNHEILEAASDLYQAGCKDFIMFGFLPSKAGAPVEQDKTKQYITAKTITYSTYDEGWLIHNLEQIIKAKKAGTKSKKIVRYMETEENVLQLLPNQQDMLADKEDEINNLFNGGIDE